MSPPSLPLHRFRQEHMTTTFEIRIAHEDATYARQASLAAFQTTARLERLLSRYRDDSEVSQLRSLAPGETLRLSVDTFSCLRLASEMRQMTGGAFDPGLGAQMDRARGETQMPAKEADGTRGQLILDPENFTARCIGGPVNLDLGAIGKGFTLDRMAEDLKEWDISRALLISGGSSILALEGPGPHADSTWEIALTGRHRILLRKGSVSSSGTAVKGAHILDPRDGSPARGGAARTWALAPTAAISDALCTAWMLLGPEEIQEICRKLPGVQAILQHHEDKPEELTQIAPDRIFALRDDLSC
jgi:FAD:protein FMN transferase